MPSVTFTAPWRLHGDISCIHVNILIYKLTTFLSSSLFLISKIIRCERKVKNEKIRNKSTNKNNPQQNVSDYFCLSSPLDFAVFIDFINIAFISSHSFISDFIFSTL